MKAQLTYVQEATHIPNMRTERTQRAYKSHQPSGRRWSNDAFLSSSRNLLPFGEGHPPPPLPDFFKGGSRGVRAPKTAQDGSKRTSDAPRWPPRWLKTAGNDSRWLPTCLQEAPRGPQDGSKCSRSPPRTPPKWPKSFKNQ